MKFKRGKMRGYRKTVPSKEKPSFYTSKEWSVVARAAKERDRWTCQNCYKVAKTPEQRRWMEAHHVVYRSKGGSDDIGNLKTLCWHCHQVLEHGRR